MSGAILICVVGGGVGYLIRRFLSNLQNLFIAVLVSAPVVYGVFGPLGVRPLLQDAKEQGLLNESYRRGVVDCAEMEHYATKQVMGITILLAVLGWRSQRRSEERVE